MKQTFTINDLVRFLYHETSIQESMTLANELAENVILKEQFEDLLEGKSSLERGGFTPSSKVLKNIMVHSRKTCLEMAH
jgi:hypothetical protein